MKRHYVFIICIILLSKIGEAQCPSFTTVLTNVSTSSLPSPFSTQFGQYGSATVLIEGTLTVDVNFTFYDAHIAMAPSSKIIINADKKLTLDKVWLNSCDGANMWEGIELPYTSTSLAPLNLLIKDGTLIEDASTAVNVLAKSGIRIKDSQLNRNRIGVNIINTASNSTAEFAGNLFSRRAIYNDPTTMRAFLLSPYANALSYGILLQETTNAFTIGSSTLAKNHFEGLTYGISTESSYTTIVINNQFTWCDLGVFSNYSEKVVVGGSSSEANRFDYCSLAAVSQFSDGEIHNNTFQDCISAIVCDSYNHNTAYVTYNTIYNSHVGISLGGYDAFQELIVSNNDLNHKDDLTYSNWAGIFCGVSSAWFYHKNVTIRDNRISNYERGIVANYLQDYCKIENNIINIPKYIPAGTYYGIDLFDCQKASISFNEVYRFSANSLVKAEGIRATNLSYGNLMKANVFIDHEQIDFRGIHLYGNCAGVQMECNYFGDCTEAMYLGSPGQQVALSSQGTANIASENDWYPYDNSYGRITADVNPIHWYYDNDDGSNFSNGKWPQTNSFDITLDGFSYSGDVCNYRHTSSLVPSRDVSPIVHSKISFSDDNDEHLYNLQSGIFQAYLHQDSMDISWIEEHKNWLDSMYEENIGILERAEYILTSANYESLGAAADESYQLFSEVSPNNVAEENKLFMLGIYYSNIMSENLIHNLDLMEAEDLEAIALIAHQNSIVGGEAVIWARTMLKLFIDDEDIIPARKRSNKNSDQQKKFRLYPNPSNGKINVISDGALCTIEIYNLQGIFQKRFENIGTNQSVFLGLENGIYVYKMHLIDSEITKRGLISIIK